MLTLQTVIAGGSRVESSLFSAHKHARPFTCNQFVYESLLSLPNWFTCSEMPHSNVLARGIHELSRSSSQLQMSQLPIPHMKSPTTMQSSKARSVIVVLGATGNQGGGVVRGVAQV